MGFLGRENLCFAVIRIQSPDTEPGLFVGQTLEVSKPFVVGICNRVIEPIAHGGRPIPLVLQHSPEKPNDFLTL